MAISVIVNDLRELGVIEEEGDDFVIINHTNLFRLDYYLYIDDCNNINFGNVSQLYCIKNVKFYWDTRVPKRALLNYEEVRFITNFKSDST